MTFADTAITGESLCRAVFFADLGNRVEPFRHHIRRDVGKMVTCQRLRRIGNKIVQIFIGANLDQIFDFFLNAFHRLRF